MRKKTLVSILVAAGICIACTGGAAGGVYYYFNNKMSEQRTDFEEQLQTLTSELNGAKKTVYVATEDIPWGAEIKEESVEEKTVYSDLADDSFMTDDQIGGIAKVDLKAGVPIYADSIAKATHEGTREIEVNYVNLNTNLEDNAIVDIRIKFPNGEDYVVCSKQTLRNLNLASADLFLWVTEEEILSLDSATVDANINGGVLYVTHYVEPALQTESVVNYQPNVDVLNLMAQDPNIVDISKRNLSATARCEMEERLAAFNAENDDNANNSDNANTSDSTVADTPAYSDVTVSPSTDETESYVDNQDTPGNEYTDVAPSEPTIIVESETTAMASN